MVFVLDAVVLIIILAGFYLVPRLLFAPKAPRPVDTDGLEFPEGFLWSPAEDACRYEGGNDRAVGECGDADDEHV